MEQIKCKNYEKGTCCGNWNEFGICKVTILSNQCQQHDKEPEKEELGNDLLHQTKFIVESATKFDSGKPSMSLIPQLALLEVAKSFGYGAKKYKKFNYSLGMEYTRLTDAALRHINLALRGKDIDEESGEAKLMHLSNAIASLMMCLDNQLNNTIKDDRNINYQV